ncbi:MAG: glycan biosynthesis hexose transferase WsfD [Bdellovibrionota bacterium]
MPLLLWALFSFRFLFLTPIHGIADNGDFWRVMRPVGLLYSEYPRTLKGLAVARHFFVTNPEMGGSTTSAVLPAYLARVATLIFQLRFFDLRLLGAFYWLVFISGLALVCFSFDSWIFAVAACWIAAEPAFFLQFNSFYSAAAELAFFPWLLWGLRREVSRPGLALTFISLFVATSKAQFTLLPFLLFLALRFVTPAKRRWAGAPLLGAGALALLWNFALEPVQYKGVKRMTNYQAIFTGIGPMSNDPAHALLALGMEKQDLRWNGVSLPEALRRNQLPADLNQRVDSLSHFRLAWLYFAEPGALGRAFESLREPLIRAWAGPYGNFEVGDEPSGRQLRFSWQYSGFREPALSHLPWLLWLVPLAAGAAGFWIRRKAAWMAAVLLFLSLQFFCQLPICVLGDGFGALPRHFLHARLAWDFMFWLMIALAVQSRRRAPTGEL